MNLQDAPATLLTPHQAAKHLGLSPRWLELKRYRGGGPPFVRISARCVRYRREDLKAWVEGRIRVSTSDVREQLRHSCQPTEGRHA